MVEYKKTRYSKRGKIQRPIAFYEFSKGMTEGKFCKKSHRGLAALLYYTGVRITEAIRAKREQFTITDDTLVFNVGRRLKHGIETAPLEIPRSKPYVEEIVYAVTHTPAGRKVWPVCRRTGYNVVDRAFPFYPHFFRLNRITQFLLENYTLPELHSWTGLTLKALNAYVGIVDIKKMSKSLS